MTDETNNGEAKTEPVAEAASALPEAEIARLTDEIVTALKTVYDPEIPADIYELGLIYAITVDGDAVHVTYTLTTPACPIGPMVAEQIEEFVSELDGVGSVESELIFMPPWTPEKMSEDAKFALGY